MRRLAFAFLMGFGLLPHSIAFQAEECVLDTARNGAVIKIRGEAVSTDHDVIIRPDGCPDRRVILVYGDDPSLGNGRLEVRRDEAFNQFEKYLKEDQPRKANEISKLLPRYRVYADFKGRLEIAASAGLKKDPKTGKPTGIEGFGHPLPFTRYRLVVTGVSKVEVSEK